MKDENEPNMAESIEFSKRSFEIGIFPEFYNPTRIGNEPRLARDSEFFLKTGI
jgi:hypothetical protein